uniref:Putative secreted protein n=1 Tax=Ixodes ricinus TaxID=34613 RepID=A0A6B0UF66_IXORI
MHGWSASAARGVGAGGLATSPCATATPGCWPWGAGRPARGRGTPCRPLERRPQLRDRMGTRTSAPGRPDRSSSSEGSRDGMSSVRPSHVRAASNLFSRLRM